MLHRKTIFTVCAALLTTIAVNNSLAANVDFDNGGAGNDWNTAANWTNNAVPTSADNVFLGDTVAGPITVAITASPLNEISQLGVGRGLTGTYTVNHSAGDLITNSWANIGQGFVSGDSVGIYNLSGGSVTKAVGSGGHNVFGGFNSAQGELHVSNNALWKIHAGFTALGGEQTGASTTVGIITISDTGRFENTDGDVFVGRGGTGTFTHDSSNTSTMGGLQIANNSQGMGTVNVNSGTLVVGSIASLGAGADIQIGRGNTTNTPELNISNGLVDHARNTVIGRDGRGVINLSGGRFDTGRLIVGEGTNQSSTLNIGGNAILNSATIENIGGNATSTVTITGSQANINVSGDLEVDEGATDLSYFADAGGVSTINVGGEARIATTDLLVDLTDISMGAGSLDLIDYGSLVGEFASIDVQFDGDSFSPGTLGDLGFRQYAIDYGSGTNDVVALQFNIPEPSAIAIWSLIGIGLAFYGWLRWRK